MTSLWFSITTESWWAKADSELCTHSTIFKKLFSWLTQDHPLELAVYILAVSSEATEA